MKTFRQYLKESKQTFKYTIKIAADVSSEQREKIKQQLAKLFDVVDIDKAKFIQTPVEKSPNGFPEISNQSLHILKLEFKYPVTEPAVIQAIRLATGIADKYIKMFTPEFDESMDRQLLQSPASESIERDAKQASKEYGESYLQKVESEPKSVTFNFAATELNRQPEAISKIQAKLLKSVQNLSVLGNK